MRGALEKAAYTRIHEVSAGEPVGEIAFFDRRARSATVRAMVPSDVLVLPFDAIGSSALVVKRLGALMASRLRVSSEDELEHAQRRGETWHVTARLDDVVALDTDFADGPTFSASDISIGLSHPTTAAGGLWEAHFDNVVIDLQ